MPHTNRKKKTVGSTPKREDKNPSIIHTKRKEVEDEEGWTHIVDTPRTRTRSSTLKKGGNGTILHGGDFEIDGVSYVNRTLEELQAEYAYWQKAWEGSDTARDLKEKMAGELEDKSMIGNVLLLGLGSLQNSRREGRRASATQLAALQTIIQTLGGEMKLVAQDPQFTDLDKSFLSSLGYTVVDDPAAFTYIREDTLVYAIHCYAQVYKAVSEAPRPAILIGTDVANFGRFDTSEIIGNIAASMAEMIDGCDHIDFPQIRHDFSDTKIYWRKVHQVVTQAEVIVSENTDHLTTSDTPLDTQSEPTDPKSLEPVPEVENHQPETRDANS